MGCSPSASPATTGSSGKPNRGEGSPPGAQTEDRHRQFSYLAHFFQPDFVIDKCMAKRGRKPRPNLLTDRPIPPDDLSPEAKAIFESVVSDLEAQQSLSTTDAKMIALYARGMALTDRIEKELSADTLTKVSEKYGATSSNPLIDRYFGGLKLGQLLLTKLGLSPQSRKKSIGSTDPEDSSWEL